MAFSERAESTDEDGAQCPECCSGSVHRGIVNEWEIFPYKGWHAFDGCSFDP
jgi:hypothetical protein